jgi:hypothetical protein
LLAPAATSRLVFRRASVSPNDKPVSNISPLQFRHLFPTADRDVDVLDDTGIPPRPLGSQNGRSAAPRTDQE